LAFLEKEGELGVRDPDMEEGRGGVGWETQRMLNKKELEGGPDLRKKPTGLKRTSASFLSRRRKSYNTFRFHSPPLEKDSSLSLSVLRLEPRTLHKL
jgi:hypothetical protein